MNLKLQSSTKHYQYLFLIIITCLSPFNNLFAKHDTKPWIDFKHSEGAFSIKLPDKPEYIMKEVPNPLDSTGSAFKLHLFMSADMVNKVNYIVRYSDFPQGLYLTDKAKAIEGAVSDLESRGKLVYGPEPVRMGKFEGVEVRLMIENRYSICRIFVRGNRAYMLLKQNMMERTMVSLPDDFFSSFSFDPYQAPKLLTNHLENENFKIKLFTKPRLIKDNENAPESFISSSTTLYSTNPNSGGIYSFEYNQIKEYYRLKNIDSLYHTLQTNLQEEGDSLLNEKTTTVNGIKIKDFSFKQIITDNINRTRIWIDEGKLFVLRSLTTDEEAFSATGDEFFKSFTKSGKAKFVNLNLSKAQKIITDLSSADTTIRKHAVGALNYYEFSEDELPVLYFAIKKTFPDDTTQTGVRVKLIQSLIDISDHQTLPNLQELYKSVNEFDDLREAVLYTIASVKQPKAMDTYFDLLTNESLFKKSSLGWKAFNPLSDSLSFAATNFNRLLPLLEHKAYRTKILELSNSLLQNEDSLQVQLIKSNQDKLTIHAIKDVEDYIKEAADSRSAIFSYLELMQGLPATPITHNFTNQLLNNPEDWISTKALIVRIKHGLKTDDKVIQQNLDSLNSRYLVMEALSKANQLQLVPQKYTQQDEFAKLCLYESLTDEDYYPERIELLGKITQQDSVHYVFNIFYKEDDKINQYIGIGGPYKTGDNTLTFDKYRAYSSWTEKKDDWETQAKELISKREED